MACKKNSFTPITSAEQIQRPQKVPELIRVPADPPLSVIAVATTLFGIQTHYDGSLTRLCPGEETCLLHSVRPLRSYFLLGAVDKQDNQVKWIQLTADAAASLLNQLVTLQVSLYGSVLRIGRQRKTTAAPIVVSLDPIAKIHGRLPGPADPTLTIEKVFGTESSPVKRRRKAV